MENYKTIDYDHSPDGLTRNANLTEEGGQAAVLWTSDRHGELVTDAYPVSAAAFARLWDGITGSLDDNGVFRIYSNLDPARLVDADRFHVIATVQVSGTRVQHRTFMVPAEATDPGFATWLALLEATAVAPGRGVVAPAKQRELLPA